MLKPDIQNDFSFYRRSLGSKSLVDAPQPISADTANVVSMWLAQNLPMTASIRRETNAVAIGNLANLCCGMIVRDACQDPIETAKVLRIMVASAVVYDRLTNHGVFSPHSIVKVITFILPLSLTFVDSTITARSDSQGHKDHSNCCWPRSIHSWEQPQVLYRSLQRFRHSQQCQKRLGKAVGSGWLAGLREV